MQAAGKLQQISFQEFNALSSDFTIPKADVIWLSQFLDCFSEAEIIAILKNIAGQLSTATKVFIMETFWDNQRFPAASYAIAATSVYFTAVANGNSKMYGLKEMTELVEQAGLFIEKLHSNVGISHTILQCRLRD